MTNVPRYRTFLATVSNLVPKSMHILFKQFKRGTGSLTKPEVPDPDRFAHQDSPEPDEDLNLSNRSWQSDDSICVADVSKHVNKSDEEDDDEVAFRIRNSEEEDPKEGEGSNTKKDGINIVNEGDENVSRAAGNVCVNSIINQLDESGIPEIKEDGDASTDTIWYVPADDTRDLLEMQIWRREFELSQTEKPSLRLYAENIKEFVVEYLKSFFNYEKALNPDREILIDQLSMDLSQLLKYEVQNRRKENLEVDLDVTVQSLKEYLLTAISYRARKLRRASVVDEDKVRAEEALSTGLFDEVADAVERRYDRLYKITQPGLAEDELEGIQLAISEVKKSLRESLQAKVSVEHQALESGELDEHFEVIDKLAELLILTVFRDTEHEHRTAGLLLECTYELVDIIIKKLPPVHGKTSAEIIEELVSQALHILSQELNKRGIAV